ncbi:hypothetical protein Vadar_000653 [Vaccinium darrowii]|uniref:Uncharacterized protein n=1 Tax=Vaccinium darrowii TaxID=229202 RepID=A0ACB7YIA5_9ERIC|nr:hypothetical protein Vadar_000653 [Vaccinium darrowii]
MSFVYAPTNSQGRRALWSELISIANAEALDWIVGGDFNAILHPSEKMGGQYRQAWELSDFQNFVNGSHLIDLGYVGYPFTWSNKRSGRDNVRVRLDRFLASPTWRLRYPSAVTVQRRQQNRLMGLQDESGQWRDGDHAVQDIALAYFHKIYTTECVSNLDSVLQHVEHRVTPLMNRFLTRPISFKEVKDAAFQMDPGKSPGPNGMGPVFLQKYWDVVGSSLRIIEDPAVERVCDLIDPAVPNWKEELLESHFTAVDARLMLSIPLSVTNKADELIWHYSRTGKYNVRSGYVVASDDSEEGSAGTGDLEEQRWKEIWKCRNGASFDDKVITPGVVSKRAAAFLQEHLTATQPESTSSINRPSNHNAAPRVVSGPYLGLSPRYGLVVERGRLSPSEDEHHVDLEEPI